MSESNNISKYFLPNLECSTELHGSVQVLHPIHSDCKKTKTKISNVKLCNFKEDISKDRVPRAKKKKAGIISLASLMGSLELKSPPPSNTVVKVASENVDSNALKSFAETKIPVEESKSLPKKTDSASKKKKFTAPSLNNLLDDSTDIFEASSPPNSFLKSNQTKKEMETLPEKSDPAQKKIKFSIPSLDNLGIANTNASVPLASNDSNTIEEIKNTPKKLDSALKKKKFSIPNLNNLVNMTTTSPIVNNTMDLTHCIKSKSSEQITSEETSVLSSANLTPPKASSTIIELSNCVKKSSSKENHPECVKPPYTLVTDAFNKLNLNTLSNPYAIDLESEMDVEELRVYSQDIEDSLLEESEKRWIEAQRLLKRKRMAFQSIAPTLKQIVNDNFLDFDAMAQTKDEIELSKQLLKLKKDYKGNDDRFFLNKEMIRTKCRTQEVSNFHPYFPKTTRFVFNGPGKKRKK